MKNVEFKKITRRTWGVYNAQEQGLKIDAYNNPVSAVGGYLRTVINESAVVKYLRTVITKKLGR